MRDIVVQAFIPRCTAGRAYEALADFSSYPDHSKTLRSVTVTRVDDIVSTSCWEIAFRGGLLRWTEEDMFDAAQRRIEFRQLAGDISLFIGGWEVIGAHDGCTATFSARFDLGAPALTEVLEPIAVNAFVGHVTSVVQGLFGQDTRVESVTAATPDMRQTAGTGRTSPVSYASTTAWVRSRRDNFCST